MSQCGPKCIYLHDFLSIAIKGNIWLVMDLCTGGNLTTRKLNEPGVTAMGEQILRGICYLHRRGIAHRDLKLENILYEDSSVNSSIRLYRKERCMVHWNNCVDPSRWRLSVLKE